MWVLMSLLTFCFATNYSKAVVRMPCYFDAAHFGIFIVFSIGPIHYSS